jgi:hypothetical protein
MAQPGNYKPSNQKEGLMKARNCCKTMQAELTAWKANVYDIVRKMEELPGGERERILPNIEDLHMLISEMDDRIEYIQDNCTPETGIDDIRTEREDFNKHLTTLRIKSEEAMRGLGAGNFGG